MPCSSEISIQWLLRLVVEKILKIEQRIINYFVLLLCRFSAVYYTISVAATVRS